MYKVVQDSEKGRAVVATKFIPAGTVVLKERPFLICEDVYDGLYSIIEDTESLRKYNGMTPFKLDKYVISYNDILEEIATLPEYMRDTFLNMPPQKLRLMVAKFYRNAFSYTDTPSALLEVGSLLNHSCDNNVDFCVDRDGSFVFTANRDIPVGTELCDTYLATYTSTKKRKGALLSQYGFQCGCVKCVTHTSRNLK